MNRHTYIPETSQRFLAGPGEQEASLIRDFDAPSQVDQALQLPALSCSLQITLTASSTPTASSSLLQFTVHPCGALLTSRCPLTSSTHYRPDTVQTTSVFFTIHRLQIKTQFPSSTTDRLRLSSFFAIAISLPLCPPFSRTVDWHSHLSARCNIFTFKLEFFFLSFYISPPLSQTLFVLLYLPTSLSTTFCPSVSPHLSLNHFLSFCISPPLSQPLFVLLYLPPPLSQPLFVLLYLPTSLSTTFCPSISPHLSLNHFLSFCISPPLSQPLFVLLYLPTSLSTTFCPSVSPHRSLNHFLSFCISPPLSQPLFLSFYISPPLSQPLFCPSISPHLSLNHFLSFCISPPLSQPLFVLLYLPTSLSTTFCPSISPHLSLN
ncbi:unnamed protein product [Acanthosepion pharaonis]|uniref:Uncharacterized protein n=1 Tax=Acanthosepion pharaonis TaxID=158019 RepID=A0A812EBS7_ACAPH|nr:unnamed protein product [Sepia pharaonis]